MGFAFLWGSGTPPTQPSWVVNAKVENGCFVLVAKVTSEFVHLHSSHPEICLSTIISAHGVQRDQILDRGSPQSPRNSTSPYQKRPTEAPPIWEETGGISVGSPNLVGHPAETAFPPFWLLACHQGRLSSVLDSQLPNCQGSNSKKPRAANGEIGGQHE